MASTKEKLYWPISFAKPSPLQPFSIISDVHMKVNLKVQNQFIIGLSQEVC
jgi:hypothetical protein